VIARLIDPACCHRAAPCPQQLGEGMTGSRTNPAMPQRICTITAWRRPHNYTIMLLHLPASRRQHAPGRPGVKTIRPGCTRALRLGPRSLPGAINTESRKPTKPLVGNVLTFARPFRDDNLRPSSWWPLPVAGPSVSFRVSKDRDAGFDLRARGWVSAVVTRFA
jgi:hypothetical protein